MSDKKIHQLCNEFLSRLQQGFHWNCLEIMIKKEENKRIPNETDEPIYLKIKKVKEKNGKTSHLILLLMIVVIGGDHLHINAKK